MAEDRGGGTGDESPGADPLDKLALALARGLSMRRAAREAGLAETTARRRAAAPGFRARVDAFRREAIDRAVGKLASAAGRAADTMVEHLDGKNSPDVRLKAARGILADLLAVRAHEELAERIAELEAKLSEQPNGNAFHRGASGPA
jgi:hypothetical protein